MGKKKKKKDIFQILLSFFLVQQNCFLLTMGRKEWTEVVRDASGFKSIFEEKATFDIPLIYFDIYIII